MRTLVVLTAALLAWAGANARKLNAATYNIRYDAHSDSVQGNGWKGRCPVIVNQILYYDFDLFGAQEVLHHQLQDMLAGLPGYASIGVGRDDGKQAGEYSPIFYKTEQFELLNSGTFWLSPTPDTPGKGWDAECTRICTWAELRDRQSGRLIRFFNTHFDHVGVTARRESARLITQRIGRMAGDAAVIVTGDFNVDQHDESYLSIARSPLLKDCHDAAAILMEQNGTFNAFNPTTKNGKRIDHIFVGRDVDVLRYAVLVDLYWTPAADARNVPDWLGGKARYVPRTPSDHYPVAVTLEL